MCWLCSDAFSVLQAMRPCIPQSRGASPAQPSPVESTRYSPINVPRIASYIFAFLRVAGNVRYASSWFWLTGVLVAHQRASWVAPTQELARSRSSALYLSCLLPLLPARACNCQRDLFVFFLPLRLSG